MSGRFVVLSLIGLALVAAVAWFAVGDDADPPVPTATSWEGRESTPVARRQPGRSGEARAVVENPALEPEPDPPVREEPPEIALRGRVVDRAGRPVEAAEVRVDTGRRRRRNSPTTRTDAEGRFEFAGRTFEDPDIRLVVQHEAFAPTLSTRRLLPEPDQDLGDVVVSVGASVVGSVVDSAGTGIPRARVQLEPQEGHPLYRSRDFDELVPPVETDRNGFFRIVRVVPGDFRIEVRATGFERERTTLVRLADEREERLDPIRLATGYVLRGVVMAPSGESVSRAEVRFQARRGRDGRARTDEKGEFSIDYLRAGSGSVRVEADGFLTYLREDVDPKTVGRLVVQLTEGLRVTGVVRDRQTGAPVTSYAVEIQRRGPIPDRSQSVEDPDEPRRRDGPSGRERRASRERRWREDLGASKPHPEGRFEFTGLDEGVYEIEVDSPDHQRAYSGEFELRVGGGASHHALAVVPGLGIRGTVVDAEGRPLSEARVELLAVEEPDPETQRRSPSPLDQLFGPRDPGVRIDTRRTDEQGRFAFEHEEPGRYRVAASLRGYAADRGEEFDLRADREAIVLELGRVASLTGTVVGMLPGTEQDVTVLAFGGRGNLQEAVVQPDATYEFDELQPGDYLVRAFTGSLRSYVSKELRRLAEAGSVNAPFDVVLAPGDAATFDPVLEVQPFGEVVGRVLLDGDPAQAVRVTLTAVSVSGDGRMERRARSRAYREDTRADQDGRFHFRDVPEGECDLLIQAADRRRHDLLRRRISVLRDSRNEQRISLQTSRLEGSVSAPDAAPQDLDGRLQIYLGATEWPGRGFEGTYYSLAVRDGAVTGDHLIQGNYWARLTLRGRAPNEFPVTLGSGVTRLEMSAGTKR